MRTFLVRLTALALVAALGPLAHAQGAARLTPEQRGAMLLILPDRLADFADDPGVLACFDQAYAGNDRALLALAALDESRRVVKRESDFVVNAYKAGASAEELIAMRRERATPALVQQVARATQNLRIAQEYCDSLHQAAVARQKK